MNCNNLIYIYDFERMNTFHNINLGEIKVTVCNVRHRLIDYKCYEFLGATSSTSSSWHLDDFNQSQTSLSSPSVRSTTLRQQPPL